MLEKIRFHRFPFLHFSEYDNPVMPAKAERITHGYFHVFFDGVAQHDPETGGNSCIEVLRINSGRDDAFLYAHDAGNGFNGAGGAKQMPGHGFGGADMQV